MIAKWTTERLVASRIEARHFDDICRLHSDRRVMQTLSADGEPLSDENTRASIAAAESRWEKHGFGFWALHSRIDGQFVGRAGLKRYTLDDLGGRQEMGLAYAVMSEFWNRGYATEMACHIVRIGFDVLGLSNIASWTLPQNTTSQRVLEKLGFRHETDFIFAGLAHRFFNLRPEWVPMEISPSRFNR